MATATRISIEVTEKDIERAHINDSYKCVVSQAIARAAPDATNIETDTQSIRFTVDGERRIYMTPYAVQGYVIAFDAGDPIEPFTFQLRDPKKAKRKIRTAAGKAAQRASTQARREAAAKASVVPPVKKDKKADSATGTTGDPRVAAKAAYAEARAAHANAPTTEPSQDGVTRQPPPRVFKKKRRAYGHRLLRINQES